VQLAGMLLICAACPVITAMAESLVTVLLAHAASLLAAARLCRESRLRKPSLDNDAHRSRTRIFLEQLQSRQTITVFSFFCVATAMALLGALGGSSSLETLRATLQESYRPDRADLLVGDGSILGITAIALLFVGSAATFGLFPMHGVVQNSFESSPVRVAGTTAILQRLQAAIVVWKIAVTSMPGFESTLLLMCVVFGAASCVSGSILACRSESLRSFAGNVWIAWGGVALVAVATGLAVEFPVDTQTVWQLPSGLENAAFSFVISSMAVGMLLAAERWLSSSERSLDFAEDLTGLGQQHGLIAFAVACALLTLSAVPPLPGFWCAAFIAGNAFMPGVESADGAALVPDTSVLAAVIIALISLLIVSARSVQFLSLMFHHEPNRRFSIPNHKVPAAFSVAAGGLLIWAGLNADTVLAWFHKLPL
jgi:formate hydrogenlyase subunit 3/multisubunit Na+/H+ antiporter MnhD subunit